MVYLITCLPYEWIQRNLNITKIFLEQLQGIEISCFMNFNGRKWKTNFLLKTMHEI